VGWLIQISDFQVRLDELGRYYDRNVVEREKAFETEKIELETKLSLLADRSAKSLRSKYQISKHAESYQDLYLEAFQLAQASIHIMLGEVKKLEGRLAGVVQQQNSNDLHKVSSSVKSLSRKLNDAKKRFAVAMVDTQEARRIWRTTTLKNLVELENALSTVINDLASGQASLPSVEETILAKVKKGKQDLKMVIDMKKLLTELPTDSDLGTLLQLYLNGAITLEVSLKPAPSTQSKNLENKISPNT
jgi:hypothetical protein